MSSSWTFAFLMPHARFDQPVEHGAVALVPPEDERLLTLAQESGAVKALTSNFTDQFGRSINPSAILVRSDALATIDYYALVSFRNAIALSCIMDGYSYRLTKGNLRYALWSDFFDFYAFTISTDDDLIASSIACTEIDLPHDFRGQRAPYLPSSKSVLFGTDHAVLEGCLRHWDHRFINRRAEWKTRALFRSLELATQASRVPAIGSRHASIQDVGVSMALWVSAFETLGHPRKGGSGLGTVLNMLAQAEWNHPALRAKRFTRKHKGGSERLNLIQKLYLELHRARNDFLHGNPVTKYRLYPMKRVDGPALLQIAPLIFRAALMVFLPFRNPRPPKNDIPAQVDAHMRYHRVQSRHEKALAACNAKPGRH